MSKRDHRGLTNHAGSSIESQSRDDSVSVAWLVARVKHLERELWASEAIHGLWVDLWGADSLETVGEITLDFLETMLEIDWGSFSIAEGESIKPVGASNSSDEQEAVGHSLAYKSVRTGKTQQFPDPRAGFKTELARSRIFHLIQLAVPIKMMGGVVGVIHLSRALGNPFTEDDTKIVETVSELDAIVLERLIRSMIGLNQSLSLEDFR